MAVRVKHSEATSAAIATPVESDSRASKVVESTTVEVASDHSEDEGEEEEEREDGVERVRELKTSERVEEVCVCVVCMSVCVCGGGGGGGGVSSNALRIPFLFSTQDKDRGQREGRAPFCRHYLHGNDIIFQVTASL